MRTEELIADLAARPGGVQPGIVGRGAAAAVALGLGVSAALWLSFYGPRPDLAAVLSSPVVLAKTVLPLALGVLALALALRAARPGAPRAPALRAIWLVPAVLGLLFGRAVLESAPGARLALFLGHSIPVCLPSIVILSAPIAALLLRALREGAPDQPARCGALAGLAAGGLATTLYSLFCTEDSPLFYAVWYSAGIGIVTLAGAAAGARFLRW